MTTTKRSILTAVVNCAMLLAPVPALVAGVPTDTATTKADFYRTPRGEFTPASSSSSQTTHPTLSSVTYPFERIGTISPRPMLFVTGDKAHSREFSEDAYQRASQPKELLIVPNAGHVDLYDRANLIPFDKLTSFFAESLK